MKGKFSKAKEKAKEKVRTHATEKVGGERAAKIIDKIPKKRKQKILKRLEKAIDNNGKVVTWVMDNLGITKDEITLLFKKTSKSGLAFEKVAETVFTHLGYGKAKKQETIGGRRFDLIYDKGVFVECKFTQKKMGKDLFDSYIEAIRNTIKAGFEPVPRRFLILSGRAGIANTVIKAITEWMGPFEVEHWSSDDFREKFLDMKLEKSGMNWAKFGEVIFK